MTEVMPPDWNPPRFGGRTPNQAWALAVANPNRWVRTEFRGVPNVASATLRLRDGGDDGRFVQRRIAEPGKRNPTYYIKYVPGQGADE